jgi:ketosteroid isomerase-like protein
VASIFFFSMFFNISPGHAQQTSLQLKIPVERPLAPKEAGHEFAVTAKAGQAFTIAVQQQGIDVVVTVLAPDGKQVIQVDNAPEEDGTGGSEIANVSALSAGEYRIRVTPFERSDAKAAKYTITLSEVRDLTPTERANAQSEKEVSELEDQWERARDKLDIATLTRILQEDAFAMGPFAGGTRTRAQIVAGLEEESKSRAKLGSVRDHTIAERSVKAAGNVAVSTLRYVITNTAQGKVRNRLSGQVVHVWAKNDAGWKLVGDYNFPFGRITRQQTETVKVDPSVLSSYAGRYQQENSLTAITLTVENGNLQAQFGNDTSTSPKLPLKAVTDTTFTGHGNPNDEITFVRSANGEVGECILISDGPAVRAIRVK